MGNACSTLTVCGNNGTAPCIGKSHLKAIRPEPSVTVVSVKPADSKMGTGPSRSQAREVIQATPLPSPDDVVPFVQSSVQPEDAIKREENETGVRQINVTPQQQPMAAMGYKSKSVPNDDSISDLDSLLAEDEPRPQTQPPMYQRPNSTLRYTNNRTAESQRLVIQPPLEISKLTLRTNKFKQNSITSHDLQAETENDWNFKKESLDGFDPSKFKIVNSQRKGNMKMSGEYNSQEEPSLLWRLGLVSPADAFSSQTAIVETRTSLPKPPSYDPTEEQLMAMIEKEYA